MRYAETIFLLDNRETKDNRDTRDTRDTESTEIPIFFLSFFSVFLKFKISNILKQIELTALYNELLAVEWAEADVLGGRGAAGAVEDPLQPTNLLLPAPQALRSSK